MVDVVGYLTESENPRRYGSDLKRRVSNEGYAELYAKCVQLKMPSSDGKQRPTDMADRETIFRFPASEKWLENRLFAQNEETVPS